MVNRPSIISAKLLLHAVALSYSIVLISFSFYVPLWDSWSYLADWLSSAITQPFNVFSFDAGGHPTFLYHFLLAIPQYLDPENSFLFFVTIAFLTVLSIYAFYAIAKRMFPHKSLEIELVGLTYMYAFMPVIFANALNHSPDYGKMVFFIFFIWSFLEKRKILSFISALVLVFCKEQGVALLIGTVAVDVFINIKGVRTSIRQHLKTLISARLVYILPVIIWLGYMSVKLWDSKFSNIWVGSSDFLKPYFYLSLPRTLSYLSGIFVINYHWVLTLFASVGVIYLRQIKTNRNAYSVFFVPKVVRFISGVFMTALVILIAVRHITRLRYFLPLYPMLLLLFYMGLLIIFPKTTLRRIVLIIVVLLFFTSLYVTTDPISRLVYGTFRFGRHDILKAASISGDCCGFGVDHIVYNLEHVNIIILLNAFFESIKASHNTVFSYSPSFGDHALGRIDQHTKHLTWRSADAFYPNTLDGRTLASNKRPQEIYFISFPTTGDNEFYLSELLNFYDLRSKSTYDHLGYTLDVYRMQRRKEALL